jgi:hypothetical protein
VREHFARGAGRRDSAALRVARGDAVQSVHPSFRLFLSAEVPETEAPAHTGQSGDARLQSARLGWGARDPLDAAGAEAPSSSASTCLGVPDALVQRSVRVVLDRGPLSLAQEAAVCGSALTQRRRDTIPCAAPPLVVALLQASSPKSRSPKPALSISVSCLNAMPQRGSTPPRPSRFRTWLTLLAGAVLQRTVVLYAAVRLLERHGFARTAAAAAAGVQLHVPQHLGVHALDACIDAVLAAEACPRSAPRPRPWPHVRAARPPRV